MWGRFPNLRKVIARGLEIAGAGVTSAAVAYLLGRAETPALRPPPPPAVVQLAPADEEMIRTVRNGQAALLDHLRNTAQGQKLQELAQDGSPATPAGNPQSTDTPAKAQKSAQASPQPNPQEPSRQEPTSLRPRSADAKARAERNTESRSGQRVEAPRESKAEARPQPVQARAATNSAPGTTQSDFAGAPTSAPMPSSQVATAENAPLRSALKRIGGWLFPSREELAGPVKDAVRPPVPVGEFQQSAM